MVKAFYSVKALRQLYKEMEAKFKVLYSRRGEVNLSYKDKLFFELCCFGLPLLDDYFANNLYSLVNYQRFTSIIETCTLLSLGEEDDFKKINVPLFESQYYIILSNTYSKSVPSFVESTELKKHGELSIETMEKASKFDVVYSSQLKKEDIPNKKLPILLGRDLEESIRFYLGYIYINDYKRSSQLTGLFDYRDADDKYSLYFFNDTIRMLDKANREYTCQLTPGKFSLTSFDEKSINSIYSMEMMAMKLLTNKIANKYPSSFIVAALTRFMDESKSMENLLIKKEFYDINTLFKCELEWMANVNSVSSMSSTLINFNFNPKLDSSSEAEVRFNSFHKDLTSPNILCLDTPTETLINNFLDSLKFAGKKVCGMKTADYLKMKYQESLSSTTGSGFLFDAPKRFFEPEPDLFFLMHDIFKFTMHKVRDQLKGIVDISVEIEALDDAVGKKDNLMLKLNK